LLEVRAVHCLSYSSHFTFTFTISLSEGLTDSLSYIKEWEARVQVFQKLLLLDLRRLELIKMFLYVLKIEESAHGCRTIERLQHRMHAAVDMALVTVLAHYDTEYGKATRAGQTLTHPRSTRRVGEFLPYNLQEQASQEWASEPLPAAHTALPLPSQLSTATSMPVGQPAKNGSHAVKPSATETPVDSTMSSQDMQMSPTIGDAEPHPSEHTVVAKFEEMFADIEKKKREEEQKRMERKREDELRRMDTRQRRGKGVRGSADLEAIGSLMNQESLSSASGMKQTSPLKHQEVKPSLNSKATAKLPPKATSLVPTKTESTMPSLAATASPPQAEPTLPSTAATVSPPQAERTSPSQAATTSPSLAAPTLPSTEASSVAVDDVSLSLPVDVNARTAPAEDGSQVSSFRSSSLSWRLLFANSYSNMPCKNMFLLCAEPVGM
jgi:hypothetical protein